MEKHLNNSYIDGEGIERCSKCHDPLYTTIKGKQFRCKCKCEIDEYNRGVEIRDKQMKEYKVAKLKKESLMANRYSEVLFKSIRETAHNVLIREKAIHYVENSYECLKKNIGVYLYGENSTGKTHLTSAMCNELLEKGYACLYTNLATIMQNTSLFEDDDDMRRKIATVDFLFIDDLGKEFIGREMNPASAKYAEKVLFETINTRYNAQLPTIFSSNYSIKELAGDLKLDQGIMERLNEMSSVVWKLTGDDWRNPSNSLNDSILKSLGL